MLLRCCALPHPLKQCTATRTRRPGLAAVGWGLTAGGWGLAALGRARAWRRRAVTSTGGADAPLSTGTAGGASSDARRRASSPDEPTPLLPAARPRGAGGPP